MSNKTVSKEVTYFINLLYKLHLYYSINKPKNTFETNVKTTCLNLCNIAVNSDVKLEHKIQSELISSNTGNIQLSNKIRKFIESILNGCGEEIDNELTNILHFESSDVMRSEFSNLSHMIYMINVYNTNLLAMEYEVMKLDNLMIDFEINSDIKISKNELLINKDSYNLLMTNITQYHINIDIKPIKLMEYMLKHRAKLNSVCLEFILKYLLNKLNYNEDITSFHALFNHENIKLITLCSIEDAMVEQLTDKFNKTYIE